MHTPRTSPGSRLGTFKFSTLPGGSSANQARAATARSAAVDHRKSPPAARLTARPERPKLAAVRAAPTVPECSTARPVLAPALMPETTRSGAGPNAPRQAAMTIRAGEAATE